MAFVTIIVMLALLEYLYFTVAVGRARTRHNVEAPATAGDENFERFHRAHQNTLEQLVVFIPAMFAAGYYANEWLAVTLGVVFLISRALYFRSYIAEPGKRGIGMIGTLIANVLLVASALVMTVRYALLN